MALNKALFSGYGALWKRACKFLFSTGQACGQKILCQIVASINKKRFHIVTHSTAASFSIKTLF